MPQDVRQAADAPTVLVVDDINREVDVERRRRLEAHFEPGDVIAVCVRMHLCRLERQTDYNNVRSRMPDLARLVEVEGDDQNIIRSISDL